MRIDGRILAVCAIACCSCPNHLHGQISPSTPPSSIAVMTSAKAKPTQHEDNQDSSKAAPAAPQSKAVANAKPGSCAADKLNTDRIIPINLRHAKLHVGLKTYPKTLKLNDHEVVLTFDDGPDAVTTPAVLDALRDECVSATFFLIGRHARIHPDLVKRELAEHHTVGHHSNTHPTFTLRGFDDQSAEDDIDAGIAAVEEAGYGNAARATDQPHVPFFRFPGFADSPALLAFLDKRPMAVFGTDIWAADWLKMTPDYERNHVIQQLEALPHHSGIILFHDTRPSTAEMLPSFLRDLKIRGYRIVHMEPSLSESDNPTTLINAGKNWKSRTEEIIAHVWPKIEPGTKHSLKNTGSERAPIQTFDGFSDGTPPSALSAPSEARPASALP